jgi:hypothetical protein
MYNYAKGFGLGLLVGYSVLTTVALAGVIYIAHETNKQLRQGNRHSVSYSDVKRYYK